MKNKENYKNYLDKYSLKDNKESKDQYEKARKVLTDFDRANDYRGTSCYHGADGGNGGMDWLKRWDKQIKQWLGWYKPIDSDVWKSNVKLPETTGRVEALLNGVRNASVVFTAVPDTAEDEDKAIIASSAIDRAIYESDFAQKATDWHRDALIHGTGIARWIYKKIEREVRFIKTKEFDEKEGETIKKGGVIYTAPEKKIIFEGFVLRPIPRHEFYESPKGTELQGNDKLVDYVIWRRKLSLEAFKEEFKNNPQAKNVDKVKGEDDDFKEEDSTFTKAPDIGAKDVVMVYEYENVKKDQYIVVANDVLIIDAPLPYNHKGYTFHKIDCIKKHDSFNGIGIADLLENLQSTSEILLNMMIDKVYRGLNQKFLIESGIYGEFTEQLIQEDTQFIPVNTVDGRALSSKIAPLDNEFVNQDSFQILSTLGRYGTIATLVDPAQMNLQKTNISATATQQSALIMEAAVNSFLKNAGWAYKYIGDQTWAMIKQKWSIPRIIKSVGESGEVEYLKKYHKVPIQGYQVENKENELKLRKVWDKYSTIELTPDLMQTVGDLDIRIAPHALQMKDRATEIQRMQMAMAQMMPFAIDPSDPNSKMMPGVKLYDARILAKEWVKLMSLPPETSLSWGFDDKDDVEIAIEDVQAIINGSWVAGVAGRSERHNLYEKNFLDGLNEKIMALQKELEKTAMPPQIDPMTGMMGQPMMNPMLMEQYNQLTQVARSLADHLSVDILPSTEREAQALMATRDFTQPPQQQQPQQQQVPMPPSMPKNMNNPTSYQQNNGGQPQQFK